MSQTWPSVTVCLPVYNGETFIRQAIKSVLEQTFADLELVISDNASTDNTGEICRAAAGDDLRVRYSRAEVNRGLAWNHNRAFQLANGRYVMWMGHDDLLDKEYIGACVAALAKDPQLVLCFSNGNHIDDNGKLIRRVVSANDGEPRRPSERFKNIVRLEHWCDAIFGLMRTDVLQQTQLHGGFADSDRVLLAEMGLRGRFAHVSQHLFSRRVHSKATTWCAWDPRERSVLFDPANAGKMIFPFLLKASGFFRAVQRARLPRSERSRCYRHLLRWLWRYRGDLGKDMREELVSVLKRNLSENHVKLLKGLCSQLFTLARLRLGASAVK